MSRSESLLAVLRAGAALNATARLDAGQVNRLGAAAGLVDDALCAAVCELAAAGNVRIHWGGTLELLAPQPTGGTTMNTFNVSNTGDGAQVVVGNGAAASARDIAVAKGGGATAGRGAVGARVSDPEALVGVLTAFRAELPGLTPDVPADLAEEADEAATAAVEATRGGQADAIAAGLARLDGVLDRIDGVAGQVERVQKIAGRVRGAIAALVTVFGS